MQYCLRLCNALYGCKLLVMLMPWFFDNVLGTRFWFGFHDRCNIYVGIIEITLTVRYWQFLIGLLKVRCCAASGVGKKTLSESFLIVLVETLKS